MDDKERFTALRNISLKEQGAGERAALLALIHSFKDINYHAGGDHLLKYFASLSTRKTIVSSDGIYSHETDFVKAGLLKECITALLERGIDRQARFGKYQAPLLFFAEDPVIFGFLCENGFCPNEKLLVEGFEGYPYFMLHQDFSGGCYGAAKKNGLDILYVTANGLTMLDLAFARFADFNTAAVEELLTDCNKFKNTPNPSTGLTALHTYVLAMHGNLFACQLIELFLQKGLDKNARTQKVYHAAEFDIPKGSTAFDIMKLKYSGPGINSWVGNIQDILKPSNSFWRKITGR